MATRKKTKKPSAASRTLPLHFHPGDGPIFRNCGTCGGRILQDDAHKPEQCIEHLKDEVQDLKVRLDRLEMGVDPMSQS